MLKFFLILLLSQLGADPAYKKIELNRVAEIEMYKDFGDIDGEPNLGGKLDTGFIVTSDENYLYIITLHFIYNDKITFSWAIKNEEMTIEGPSKDSIQIEGKLVYKDVGEDLSIWKVKRPSNFKPSLCKFAYPKKDEKLYAAIKSYYTNNRINSYILREVSLLEGETYLTNNDEYAYVKGFSSSPRGGGIIFNSNGDIVGIIVTYMTDHDAVKIIPGTTIEKFIKDYQNKDVPPQAPKDEVN